MIPFIYLGLGLLLVLFEFYLPGAILGVIGGCLIFASLIIFASETSSIIAIIAYVLGTFIALALLIRFALKRIVNSRSVFSIYSREDQEGFKASSYDAAAIGKRGIVLSDLKPGGYILINGVQHQALSISGYIPKGHEVLVLSGQEESLIVKSITKE